MARNGPLLVLYFLMCSTFPTVHSIDVMNGSIFAVVMNNSADVEQVPKIVDADHFNVSDPTADNSSSVTPSTLSTESSTITTMSTSTTTQVADTTTTTTKPTKRPRKPLPTSSNNDRRVCNCDLHIKSCDMNCCCDADCSKTARKVFQFCINSEFYEPQVGAHRSHNSHSCFRSQIFYRENSPYYIEEANGGMFCVVKDNVEHVDQLEPEPKDVDLNFLNKKKLKFSWDFVRKMQPEISWEPYKYGSYLLQVKATSQSVQKVSPFGIPSSLYSKQCSAIEFIKFLQPMETRCKIQVKDLKSSCTGNSQLNVNTFLKNTAFILNPSSGNITENLAPLIMGLCTSFRNGSRLCRPIPSFNEPKWDEKSSTCFNILERLELTFIHSGIEGLSKVIAKGQLGDYNSSTLRFKKQEISQEFSTNFFWRTITNEEPTGSEEEILNMTRVIEKERQLQDEKDVHPLDWPRSGNPGYILGKPVVMGIMVLSEAEKEGKEPSDRGGTGKQEVNKEDKESDEESENESSSSDKGTMKPQEKLGISLDRNPSGWMTIHEPGICQSDPRSNVLFGMGHQSECLVNISNYRTCSDLQLDMIKIMLGVLPADFEESPRYVAAFGNPDLDDMNDWVNNWVPVLLSGPPTSLGKGAPVSVNYGCDGILSTMKIKIAYAYVGPVTFPQAKIVGVLYEFGDSFNIPNKLRCLNDEIDCIAYQHQVRVATTVIFIDVTQSAKPKVGQWPVVSIKLPQDFFYPFATTSGSSHYSSKFLWSPLMIIFQCFIILVL